MVRLTKMADNAEVHCKTGLEKFLNPSMDYSGFYTKLVGQKLTNSVWNKEELPEEWQESVIVPIYKNGDKTYCSDYRGISLPFIQHRAVKVNPICRGNYWGSSVWILMQRVN